MIIESVAMHFRVLLLVVCLELVLATYPRISYLPGSGLNSTLPNRVTKFPVCGILGFTSELGDNDLGVFPPPPISLHGCVKACRHNETCNAVSYSAKFSLCSFYGQFMKFDQLDRDNSSNFAHYDKVCHVLHKNEGVVGPRV